MELRKLPNLPRQNMSKQLAFLSIILSVIIFVFFSSLSAKPAQASKSSAGELIFFPCNKCHPLGPNRPNNFKGHKIELEGHDKLGPGNSACFTCHQSANNPDLLRLADGSFINIDGDVSKVCYRCHFDKYQAWEHGLHGKQPGCTAKGCHNPHSPAWIAISPIPPFLGITQEVKVAGSGREPFEALPPPPEQADLLVLPITRISLFIVIFGVAVAIGGSIYLASSDKSKKGRS